ncbi:putative ankyrin repeat protein RF_0381 [Nasonia vitripennis]|uniref:Uncharacterized protein n=1 Tax=Nasonia vitripennis TaxID=7425 RepID=A0A7M7HD34_NASVI|nr:putative ankyrin repeat protein RF_0381 [Nasonia vitripennis]
MSRKRKAQNPPQIESDEEHGSPVPDNLENTALHLAAKNGDIETAAMLIDQGANLHQKNKQGMTALHVAAENGYCGVLNLLLSRGSMVDELAAGNRTSLHIAAEQLCRQVVKELLNKGANVRIQDSAGNTPLHQAVMRLCLDSIELLVKNGAPMDFQNNQGETVLHIASQHRNNAIVNFLLEKGADCNALTADGSTPLHYAVKNFGAPSENAASLIEAGAAVFVTNHAGEIPLKTALKYERNWRNSSLLGYLLGKGLNFNKTTNQFGLDLLKDMNDEFINHPALCTVFIIAIVYDDRPLFEMLIKKGVSIHKNDWGTTPLHNAVHCDNLHAAEVLLQLGADPNVKDYFDKGTLAFAKSEQMVELLLMYNADLYEPDLLHGIVRVNANGELFDRLIEKVLDHEERYKLINQKCSRGYSLLHYALRANRESMLLHVLHAGVEPEEFFRVFLRTCLSLDPNCLLIMTRQMVIFNSQGIINFFFMFLYMLDEKRRKIYFEIAENLKKTKVTRICKDYPFTYYDLLTKHGDDLVRMLRNHQIRRVTDRIAEIANQFGGPLHISLVLNLRQGIRRLELESQFNKKFEALNFIPYDVVCHVSKYLNNSDLFKTMYALEGPHVHIS